MLSSEGPGQRARVRAGQAVAGNPAQQPASAADYASPHQAPCRSPLSPASQKPVLQAVGAANTQYGPAITAYKAPTPPSAGFAAEPPAPRSWTPSRANQGGSPSHMTPTDALYQEMAELCSTVPSEIGSRASALEECPRSAAAATGIGSNIAGTYKKPCYSNTCGQEASAGRAGSASSAAVPAGQPFVAQHNNLVLGAAGANGMRSGTSIGREAPVIAKLKGKLAVHHNGGKKSSSSTAVEAFSEPAAGVIGYDAAQRAGGNGARLLFPGHASSASPTTTEWEAAFSQALSSGSRLAALQMPGPSNGVIRCFIKRDKGLLGISPMFELRLESSDELLAVARKRKKSAKSSYLISIGGNAVGSITRADEQLVGKLKANLTGTDFLLRGKGGDPSVKKGFNAQLLAVSYASTVNHVHAEPRTMTAVVPVPETQVWNGNGGAIGGQYDSLTACMEAARARNLPPLYERDLVMLHTIKPHFDSDKQVHYLDFKGRVSKTSMKNFQLVHWDHNTNQLGNDLVMLFGKKGHNAFAMNFCYPLAPLEAFALALSSIDSKLCYAV